MLIKKSKLFDAPYYLNRNPDVTLFKRGPLLHYVLYGDKENRQPMQLFSPGYYNSQSNRYLKDVNSILHYCYIGRYKRISPTPWFNVKYYLKYNRDVVIANMEPIAHYLKYGGLEGRSPNKTFNGKHYLQQNPELKDLRIPPLLHYLNHGVKLGLSTNTHNNKHKSTYKLDLLNLATWESLSSKSEDSAAEVDIVIPVYKNTHLTLKCIYSVLTSNISTKFTLTIINDCSPEAEINNFLDKLAKLKLFEYKVNKQNLGFVKTANMGLSLHKDRDVVLLNSDTETYNDWLDRLKKASLAPNTASVTPLSNNATICSYPTNLEDNPFPLEVSYGNLDLLAKNVNDNITVDAPTGVGFCMYMTRKAIEKIGYFNEQLFGKGYGEENDWCQRALKQGFRNVLASNIFIRHFGSASFQGERQEKVARALTIINKLHPSYQNQVQRFIKNDTLLESRQRLDLARLKFQAQKENVLIISHNRGGGTERHIKEDTQFFLENNIGVFYLRPVNRGDDVVRLYNNYCMNVKNLPEYSLDNLDELADILKHLNITTIHTHGLVDFSIQAPQKVSQLVKLLQCTFNIEIHDYKTICPNINLVDYSKQYCGEPSEVKCNICLKKKTNSFDAKDISQWRQYHHSVLQAAANVYAPNKDVIERLKKYYPDINYRLSPHADIDQNDVSLVKQQTNKSNKIVILVIGAISNIKGYNVLLGCALDAKKRRLPIQYKLMGFSQNDRILAKANIKITGKYLDSEADNMIKTINPTAIFLPSIWPETYSYTLSHALKSKKPTYAFGIGAIGNRLKEVGFHEGVMPLDWVNDYTKVNDYLLESLI